MFSFRKYMMLKISCFRREILLRFNIAHLCRNSVTKHKLYIDLGIKQAALENIKNIMNYLLQLYETLSGLSRIKSIYRR
jgi:hypothetical protein